MNFAQEIVLETDRVRLEPLRVDHLPALTPLAVDYPDLLRYSPSPFGSAEALSEYVHGALAQHAQSQRYPFAIYDKPTLSYVGSTSFGQISPQNQRLEIGWTWINPELQGSGLNTHCKFLMLQFAFEQLAYERVEFRIDARNGRSRRAVEKIGGKHEGTLRSHTLMRDGFRRDTAYYGILKSEWPELRRTVFSTITSTS